MGWLGRSAGVLAAVPLMAACVSAPSGAVPNPAPNGVAGSALPMPPSTGADRSLEQIPEDCEAEAQYSKRQLRGAWIATVRNIDWPSKAGLSAEKQQQELVAQFDRAVELGLNAVFFHVRPTADAVYASDKEPWARYLTGEQGGDPGYDPLEFAVAEAHRRGLELHAWFNPYRVGWRDPDLENLADDHPARKHPDWLIEYADQGYFDPGNPDVRAWVGDVVLDVVDRYDIDGVHFDDYFYPYPEQGEEFDDDASWEEHGGEFDDRGDWRRDNVNRLVADIDERIDETKPWVRFGVSPFGIWRNEKSDPSGSDTRGLESYSAQYADTRTWIQEGWVDYVTPQLYWHRGFETADYEKLVPWWADEVAGTDVDLYIGQAAYRVGEADWKGDDALARQLDFNTGHPEVTGDVYFSMKDLGGRAATAMERLGRDHYRRPALPPRAEGAPAAPAPVTGLRAERSDSRIRLQWQAGDEARMFAVYRMAGEGEDLCALNDAANLVGVVGADGEGAQGYVDEAPLDGPARYYVTALDAYRTESAPAPVVTP
ncbi:uncharacterized lipoprotein YddW (UPF0748 family) [Spinactinospora alkalitolerans]|uniref:Uncharacterized lipoprotein YddW (UPF0748 family) n=1 Tax=Spinactinospora alkalitolerans TaxID=687207 RepID=A0A852TWF8_9ACTN|nr:family 10 glycosylhydrolase [Spinactinospora alkalitolerans]NYE48268.1 uncharacterized lipoprotein YddW (UPF0748 family) [Spinactinospora alkalitolerans]